MNKTLAFILIAVIATLGLAAVVVLLILAPEHAPTVMNFLMNLLILLAGFGGLAAMQAKQSEEIATIKQNTNGTLTRRDEEIATLRAALAEHAPEALRVVETASIPITRAQLREEREQVSRDTDPS